VSRRPESAHRFHNQEKFALSAATPRTRVAEMDTPQDGEANAAEISATCYPAEIAVRRIEDYRTFYRRTGKRWFDATAAFMGIVVLSPLLALVALLIKFTSRGPVLYWQDRVGLGGKIFKIAKFRTMVTGADQLGPGITMPGDARVTRVGAVLRKLKIDELPQLWNVLKGHMSLVGPRPEVPTYVASYTVDEKRALTVRPGITDISSIKYRHEEQVLSQSEDPESFYVNVIMPHKLSLDIAYIDKISFFFDLKLIFLTIASLFGGAKPRQL
jgi:lipopolysaccharide/colanic/teichoic acid biosynthesis glycosyltransferase